MELYLQFGYGMMDHSRALVDAWDGGTVILSPRDLDPGQLARHAAIIRSLPGGEVLLDPQFYLPDADHGRLTSHDFWPDQYATGTFWSGDDLRALLRSLVAKNASLGCTAMILPGLYAERVDDDWIDRQSLIVEESKAVADGLPVLITIAIGADAVRSNDDIDQILSPVEKWEAWGVYLVCEHPRGEYLVNDATWMTNVLDLVAGMRLKGKHVYVGYCNHQMLALACAGADAVASGTWMNVRSFPPSKFRTAYDEEIKQRAVWYYAPAALSEYKIPFLDVAQKQGVLDLLKADPKLGSKHADPLFAGPQPSAVKWSEQSAFRHYLQCLRGQVAASRFPSFDDTVAAYEKELDATEALLARLHAAGVRGQLRDFKESLDANRAAIAVLRSSRGAILRRQWAAL